jgi:hypothetical protein
VAVPFFLALGRVVSQRADYKDVHELPFWREFLSGRREANVK